MIRGRDVRKKPLSSGKGPCYRREAYMMTEAKPRVLGSKRA